MTDCTVPQTDNRGKSCGFFLFMKLPITCICSDKKKKNSVTVRVFIASLNASQ